jgi:hypothetical protein
MVIKIDLNVVIKQVIKRLITENSLPKNIKVNDKTNLIGNGSPFDSVTIVEFTTSLESEISKKINKKFFIILNEIPEYKKNNQKLTLGGLKSFLKKKF